jgi:cellulose biosynthesis protein BcsQ
LLSSGAQGISSSGVDCPAIKTIPQEIPMAPKSFAIWNNKGGVGKSTITFHIASRYAEKHQKTNVLVIDLCPQSNVSMMLLGGGKAGEDRVVGYCVEGTPKTVVGYLGTVIAGGERAPLPDPFDYIVSVRKFNDKLPANLYLLPGDGNLEPMAPALANAAIAPALTATSNPWRWVHCVFSDLIAELSQNQEWVVFVDTNPSFSIYTEIAVSSVDRLIVPVNADDSSRVATNAMFVLLHGTDPPHPIYGSWTYATRATKNGINVPRVHLVVGNRLTQYEGAASAFQALSDATVDTLYGAFKKHPDYFTPRSPKIRDKDQFRDAYSVLLRDFNTAGVVSAHGGQCISSMKQGGAWEPSKG